LKKAAHNASIKGISLNQYINEAIKKEIASSDPE
jgi:predicted HicB family RNase H-like nuclease